jgi:hypothetical protein
MLAKPFERDDSNELIARAIILALMGFSGWDVIKSPSDAEFVAPKTAAINQSLFDAMERAECKKARRSGPLVDDENRSQ